MKANSRRRFLRNSSLAATGVIMAPGYFYRQDVTNNEKHYLSCAPTSIKSLTGSVSSIKSGNWSDAATWGGKLPGTADTPVIAANHVVVFDVPTATVNGININAGGTLSFSPTKSATLKTAKNIIVQGLLQMKPNNAAVIQLIQFINVDEAKFVGGGMDPLDSDVGLWVSGAGQLDLAGTSKTSWTTASDSVSAGITKLTLAAAPAGWISGDEISITPTESPTAKSTFTTGFDIATVTAVSGSSITINTATKHSHPKVNNQWSAEVINLSRNVRIEGTATGRTHLFIRSTKVQSIKYVALRYMGPRKDRGGTSVKELVAGRYGLHFHHCMDSSRKSVIEGNVVRDTNNHSYVPHVSHGITFTDNIAYNVQETAFWYDPGDDTHDVLYDHNIVAQCNYVADALDMNAEDAPTFSASGFSLNTGDGNTCINNVVVGQSGDPEDGAAYNWEAVLNEGVWTFKDNIAHNNANGIRVWQNSTRNHVIEDFTAYNNALAIFHGAYANSYTYNRGTLYANGIQIKAASVNSNRVKFENISVDGAGIVDYCVRVIESPLDGVVPVFLRNLTLKGHTKAAISDESPQFMKSIDVIGCTISGTAFFMSPSASAQEVIRVQPTSGQATRITKSGTTNINAFAPTIWGEGTGLKADYYNSVNFTNLAFSRIDSNVSFTEWANGIHHAITSNTYSIRWTGQVQAQYSEAYVFTLGSGGGQRLWINNSLVIDGWDDHYPETVQSKPITLVAGQKYDLKLEYFNTDARTGMELGWSSPRLPAEYIPQSQLFPAGGGTGTVVVAPVPTFSNLTLAGRTDTGKNVLAWSYTIANMTVQSLILETSTNNSTFTTVTTLTADKTQFSLLATVNSYYRLRVKTSNGSEYVSNVVYLALQPAQGTKDPTAKSTVTLRQTVVTSAITVQLTGSTALSYWLYDMSGNVLLRGTLNPGTTSIPVSKYGSGMGTLKISNGQSFKVIKN